MKKQVGLMLSEIAFSNMPIIFKNSGLDFFILDCEHGAFDYSDISKIVTTAKLCGLKVIIRIPDNSRRDIIRFMDMGATGLLLPMTNCKEDIEKVVKYAKYQPVGERGVSTMRAHTLYNPPKVTDYMPMANARTKVFAQIETVAGVQNVNDILAVNGVDGVFVGPNDLSADYGCLSNSQAPEILNAIQQVGSECKKQGKIGGIITTNKIYNKCAEESGLEMFSVGSELNAISLYCKDIVAKIKG